MLDQALSKEMGPAGSQDKGERLMEWEAGDRKWTGVIPRDRDITGHSQREERKELLFPMGMQAL